MFFGSWSDLGRVILVGTLAYLALVFLLLVSGKRSLSKMNSFDFVVTVALGSTLATILLSKDVSLAEGVTAFALLLILQFSVTWLSVRLPWFKNLVKAEPTLIYYEGEFLPSKMKKMRVLEEEIRQAARSEGFASLEDIEAVVLETDGTFSVMSKTKSEKSALKSVDEWKRS